MLAFGGGLCSLSTSNSCQSPIEIEQKTTIRLAEKTFRLLSCVHVPTSSNYHHISVAVRWEPINSYTLLYLFFT